MTTDNRGDAKSEADAHKLQERQRLEREKNEIKIQAALKRIKLEREARARG